MSEADEYGPGGLYADGPNTDDAARDDAYMNVPDDERDEIYKGLPEDDNGPFPNPDVQMPHAPPIIEGTDIIEEV